MSNISQIAFALGGLGGNNAHGAGFLQAALDKGVKPTMISCTSGQIYWTYLYLQALQEGKKHIIEQEVENETDGLARFRKVTEFALGIHEFVRPVYPPEIALNMSQTMLAASRKLAETVMDWPKLTLFKEYRRDVLNVLPGRLLAPNFSEKFLGEIASCFNKQTHIGLAFNAFNSLTGCETVHLNEIARQRLDVEFDQGEPRENPDKVGCDQPDQPEWRYRSRTRYQPITARSVMDGLWIYQYGFDKSTHPIYAGTSKKEEDASFDGAFWRQIMLSELTWADKIYVVRPICYRWIGSLPQSYMEIEDLKLEMMFNSAYMGERDKIYLINKLIRKKENTLPGYHCIDLIEIEVRTQEDYLSYLSEDKTVFDDARVQALVVL